MYSLETPELSVISSMVHSIQSFLDRFKRSNSEKDIRHALLRGTIDETPCDCKHICVLWRSYSASIDALRKRLASLRTLRVETKALLESEDPPVTSVIRLLRHYKKEKLKGTVEYDQLQRKAHKMHQKLAHITNKVAPSSGNLADDSYRVQECVVCLSAESSVVYVPCGHQCVCIDCTSQLLGTDGHGALARKRCLTLSSADKAVCCPLCRTVASTIVYSRHWTKPQSRDVPIAGPQSWLFCASQLCLTWKAVYDCKFCSINSWWHETHEHKSNGIAFDPGP